MQSSHALKLVPGAGSVAAPRARVARDRLASETRIGDWSARPGATKAVPIDGCATPVDLRNWLQARARALGFYSARYVHIGHALHARGGGQHRPIRFLSTSYREDPEEELASWLACDPAATAVRAAYAPFAWSTRPDDRLSGEQSAWLAAQRALGISAGLAVPVQDYACGPAYLNLFGIDEAAAARLSQERAAELAFEAAQFHAAAKSILPMTDSGSQASALTGREIEVLRLAVLGRTVPETAAMLGIHYRTVEYHLKSAGDKLGATSKVRAVAIAVSHGLIHV